MHTSNYENQVTKTNTERGITNVGDHGGGVANVLFPEAPNNGEASPTASRT